MRQPNKYISSYRYEGKFDKGGNNQKIMTSSYFKPFADSYNLQLHGVIPNGIGFVGSQGPAYTANYSNKQKRTNKAMRK